MTGLIGSLVGVASTAVERLAGSIGPKSGATATGDASAGEFSALLASLTAGVVATRSQGNGAFRMPAALGEQQDVPANGDAEDESTSSLPAEIAALLGGQAIVDRANTAGARSASTSTTSAIAVETSSDTAVAPNTSAATAIPAAVDAEANAAVAGAEATVVTSESASGLEVAPVDVPSANQNLNGLQPEFRKRLDRVIDRMKAEFGHTVTVVEGLRTQERQNSLYEQGRTRPGNVVTWTRNSNHLIGRAVDVMIDGSYDSPAGYERLAQIAAQEGLQTLGANDPGHIELPRNVPGGGMPGLQIAEAPGQAGLLAEPAASRNGGLARVAQVAQVAQVADLARVAEVARVADPSRSTSPLMPSPTVDSSAAVFAARTAQSGFEGSGSGFSDSRRQNQEPGVPSSPELELLRVDPGYGRTFAGNPVAETQLVTGSDAVQRAAQILAMKEGGSTAPVNHLLLRLDGANGGEDRIRVDLRGNSIGTTLNIQNPSEAQHLASRIGELQQSLERHGLEAETVRVRTTQVIGGERIEMARALTASEADAGRNSGNSRSGSDSAGKHEGWKEAQEQQRRDATDSRNRSRKEQPKEENT